MPLVVIVHAPQEGQQSQLLVVHDIDREQLGQLFVMHEEKQRKQVEQTQTSSSPTNRRLVAFAQPANPFRR